MYAIAIIVLWTWGLTPLWVNIVGTILCSLKILDRIIKNHDNLSKQ